MTVAKYKIKEVGKAYVVFADAQSLVCVDFADDNIFPNLSKEETAASFLGLEGKPAALPEPLRCDPPGRLFIGVDILPDIGNSARVIPNYFAVSTIKTSVRAEQLSAK